MPLLDSDPAWLTVPSLVPGTDPLPDLARVLATTATRLELSWSASDVRGRLEAGTDGLRRVADDLLAAGPGAHQRRLLVPVDQAEELFTRTTPDALKGFAQLLRNAVTGPVHVVAAMRSEFLDDLRDLPELTGVPIEAHVLAPLNREMLRDVIDGPAKVARLRLDDGLAAALVADTDSGEALPLLAFTLLLSDADDDDQRWLTVAHEALFTGWRPLDTATADITNALRTARTVEQAATDWNRAGPSTTSGTTSDSPPPRPP